MGSNLTDSEARENQELKRLITNLLKTFGSSAERLERIMRDLELMEEDIREQASGSQDGYLLSLADRIKEIIA